MRAAPTAPTTTRQPDRVVDDIISLPIVVGVLYPRTGWPLDPMIAAAAMSLSSGRGRQRAAARDGAAFAYGRLKKER
jgi:hypothetical protein